MKTIRDAIITRFLTASGRWVAICLPAIVMVVVATGCRRVGSEATEATAVVGDSLVYEAATPDALPATVYVPGNDPADCFIDSTGTIVPAPAPFAGAVSAVYDGLYVMGKPGNMNIYSALNFGQPLNSEPFSSLTDFRMGVAYGTRPGRGLMVVNRAGAVVRILPDYIRAITLPDAGGRLVALTTTDVPLTARLSETAEEYFRADSAFVTPSGARAFWPSIELVAVGDGSFRMFDRADGRAMGREAVRPLDTRRFGNVVTGYISPDEAADMVRGISSAGWEIDSSFYSASTPGALVTAKAGVSPLQVVYNLRNHPDRQVYSIGRPGRQALYMTLTAPAYVSDDRGGLFASFFSIFSDPVENKASRLRTITMPVTTDPAFAHQFMKAAEQLVLQRGYIGFADKSHAFKGQGETYLYFVPSNRGFFIVMAFGPLDYPTLTSAARSPK